jgi:Domain of unknown function (DUF4384)
MHASTSALWRRMILPLLAAATALTGCSTLDVKQKTVEQTQALRQGPQAAPFRSITGFSQSLRCMDKLLIDYGVRDVNMLVEDIFDQTKKVNAGTRDMLITAVSDMTRRSRAIRVNAFGRDATNVISFLASAQRQGAYEVVPQFGIKGSITQFDENVVRNQKDLGVNFQPFLNLGASKDAATSILGLDLSVLSTDDMAILSGVTSRNSVVIFKQGRGLDTDAAYHKFGVSFSMSLNQAEGQSQALRGLVELASIELMGKLTKTPYWTCLGADPQSNEEIKLEMADWYYAMAASQVELVGWFQNQLRQRGYYQGPIDGQFNPAIDEAIANYRAALGMSREAVLEEKFFIAFLTADHSKIARPAKPAVAQVSGEAAVSSTATAAPASAPSPAATAATAAPANDGASKLEIALSTPNRQTRFARGEPINLLVQPSRDAYVYCYLQDENNRITRFYPNRFARDAFVPAARPIALPGRMRFQLAINTPGAKEAIACFAAGRELLAELPASVVGVDFEPLPVATLAQIRTAFNQNAGGTLAEEILHVQAK